MKTTAVVLFLTLFAPGHRATAQDTLNHPRAAQFKSMTGRVRRQESAKTGRTTSKPAAPGLLADGIDPVCRMMVEKGTTITAQHAGHQYGFCSELCKKRFEDKPAQYVAKP